MHIYIPSLGRHSREEIMRGPIPLLPPEWLSRTTVVVSIRERASYSYALSVVAPDCGLRLQAIDYDGIAEKRTRIGEMAERDGHEKFMMLDDDINFLRRAEADTAAQMTMREPADVNLMLMNVMWHLDRYPQVALGLREVNKTGLVGPMPLLEECGKCMRAVAYQTQVFRKMQTMRVRTMSDYDTTLQILEAGHKNAILWFWMSGQRSTQAPGGCAIWRTNEVHEQSVDRMVELHPGLVKKRTTEKASGGEFGTRSELTIQWKKAYKQGVENASRDRQAKGGGADTDAPSGAGGSGGEGEGQGQGAGPADKQGG